MVAIRKRNAVTIRVHLVAGWVEGRLIRVSIGLPTIRSIDRGRANSPLSTEPRGASIRDCLSILMLRKSTRHAGCLLLGLLNDIGIFDGTDVPFFSSASWLEPFRVGLGDFLGICYTETSG
jgi:hypothetical protein